MHRFEILIVESSVSKNGGPFVPDGKLTYGIPQEAQELLEPILAPYNQSPMWYFDKLNFGRPPAPWALACLDHEYAIGGHVATSRLSDGEIAFVPYTQIPKPMPHDFVPGVGVLTFRSKKGLENSASRSPLFAAAWEALQQCSPNSRWLVILDPPSQEWLTQVLPSNREHWLSYHRK